MVTKTYYASSSLIIGWAAIFYAKRPFPSFSVLIYGYEPIFYHLRRERRISSRTGGNG